MTNSLGTDLGLPGRLVLRASGIFCASGSGQGGLTVWHGNAPKWPLLLNPLLQSLFGIYLQLWEVCWRKFLEAVLRLETTRNQLEAGTPGEAEAEASGKEA